MKGKKPSGDAERDVYKVLVELRATLYSIGDGVIVTDATGHVTRMNPIACALTGWSEADAVGKRLDDVFRIVSEKTGVAIDNPAERVMREGKTVVLANDSLLIARDWTARPIADCGAPILDEQGAIIGVVLVFHDQTAERAAKKALEESEEKFRTFFDRANDGMLIADARSKKFLYGNSAICSMLGYAQEELKNLTVSDIHPPKDLPRVFSAFERNAKGEKALAADLPVLRKDGTTFYADISAAPHVLGEIPCVLGIFRDITKRKQAEEALRESEDFLKSIYRAAPTGIGVVSNRLILSVNDRVCEMSGYSREELVGQNARMLYPSDADYEYVGAEKYRQIKERGTGTVETRWQRKDGRIIDVLMSSTPINQQDFSVGVTFTALDITERKQAEAEKEKLQAQLLQSQKMESVGRLAGGVAHDFNNMLAVIMGHVALAMLKINPSEPLHAHLAEIQNAAQRSADLTRQLLAFARKQTVAPKVLNLNDTVSGMLKMLLRLIGEDINLVWMPGTGLWSIKMDPSQVDQLLANLCVNARDAIAGVGRVTIETENVFFDDAYCALHTGYMCGEYVMLGVSDNGKGMSKEVFDHLFEPFFTTKEVGKGTGLGLATVYGIVKQNEGFICVSSDPSNGTSFKIYLPRFAGDVREPKIVITKEAPRGRGEVVLLVEDEVSVLNVSRSMLEGLGYTVLTANRPGEALAQAKAHTAEIQLLITDVVMPEMHGRDLAKLVREIKPGLKCLFISGYTTDVIAHRGVLDEAVYFLQKPFSIKDLASKVSEALHGA